MEPVRTALPHLARPATATKVVTMTVAAAVGGVLAILLLFTAITPTGATAQATSTILKQLGGPQPVPHMGAAGGPMCSAISPAIIAAQDQTESGWNPRAVSPAGAEGIAQFLPGTFLTWGRNDDGTGNVSPFNPADAIMAQGRYDCSLAALAQQLIDTGQASGTATDLALAAYNAGPGAVEAAHGIPADAAAYVHKIDILAATTYSVTTGNGTIAVDAAESALGTPYQYGGSCDDPHGPNLSGWCDCSSLVQMAWRTAGIELPRTTYQQVHSGTSVPSIANLQPGDLIFIPGSDGTAFSWGQLRWGRSSGCVSAAQRLMLSTLPCATGVAQCCYRRVA
jgi:hypothetical protein